MDITQVSVSRRATLRGLSLGIGALVAAACVPVAVPAPSTRIAADQPRKGGVLHFAQSPDLQSVDPSITASQNRASTPMAYDTLTLYDENLKPQPMLAESWDTSDYKAIKLSLRKGVQYHTGRELTAEDIKYNLLRVRDPKVGASQQAAQSAWFNDIQTPDKYTLILKSDRARLGVFDFFEFFRIGDKETLEGPEAKTKAVGTGPFVWKEWAQGHQIRLTRNPSYWQSGKPYLDEYVVHIVPDAQSLVTQLEAGALDMAAEYSQLIEDIGTEPDDAKRKALLSKLNDYFLDNVFMIEVASSPGVLAMAPSVNGFHTAVSGSYRFDDVWLSA